MTRHRRDPAERFCGKGTMHGAAAMESAYGFAACTLPAGHTGRCDSGPATTRPSA
jgi:hypothetical protein